METFTNKINLIKSLLRFQSEVPTIFKSSQGYGYKYADLSEIMRTIQPILSKYNLGITQDVNTIKHDGNILVTTTIFHISGEFISSTISERISDNLKNQSNHIQTIGSIISYLRRYGISSILNLVTDIDNDGNPTNNTTKTKIANGEPIQTTKPDDWISDQNGVIRYNKTKKCFDDVYQKKHDLIDTKSWITIRGLIINKIGGNIKQFTKWLKDVYKVEFYNIRLDMYAGIVKTLEENEKIILEYSK